ncbi:putative non-specific serine/threonine protein kinase [Helianthus annuus]|nr:putative non-specific serine/threonine protein kinase [Helianthus annuus]
MCYSFFLKAFLLNLAILIQMHGVVSGSHLHTDQVALLKIKSRITNDPHGVFRLWNDSLPICKWLGVTCGRRHQRVTSLNLTGKGLAGSLSPFIGNRTFLRYVILNDNQLHGRIPPEIGCFRSSSISPSVSISASNHSISESIHRFLIVFHFRFIVHCSSQFAVNFRFQFHVNFRSIMVNHNARLDAHEQLIQKLQDDLTTQSSRLDSIAATLEADRLENSEFRNAVLAWMKQQEQRIDDSSSGFEFAGNVFSALGSKSDLDTPEPPISASVYLAHEVLTLPSRSPSHLLDPSSNPTRDCMVDRSSGSISPLPPLIEQVEAIVSRSEVQSFGQGRLVTTWVKWAISDDVHWKLGSEPVVGHDVELKTVVDLDYPDPGQGVEQIMVVGLIFSDLDLCERGKAPFDRGKSSLSHRPLIGTRLTFSATWHLWVVHGQPRPPDVAVNPSLEDKTVSKGGVLLGIICLLCYF